MFCCLGLRRMWGLLQAGLQNIGGASSLGLAVVSGHKGFIAAWIFGGPYGGSNVPVLPIQRAAHTRPPSCTAARDTASVTVPIGHQTTAHILCERFFLRSADCAEALVN